MKKKLLNIIFVLLACVFCFSSIQLVRYFVDWKESKDIVNNLVTEYVTVPQDSNSGESLPEDSESSIPSIDINGITETYEDVVAWLYCPESNINYPVLKGQNNETYLYHLPDGTYNRAGSLFIDENCAGDFTTQNTIIYGHNMRYAGTMFADLVKYKDSSFYEKVPYMYLYTKEQTYRLILVAGVLLPTPESAIYEIEVSKDTLASLMAQSSFNSGLSVPEENIVTLSTCSYEYEDARYVVIGYLEPMQ